MKDGMIPYARTKDAVQVVEAKEWIELELRNAASRENFAGPPALRHLLLLKSTRFDHVR